MREKLEFIRNRMRERLWIKPLFYCLVSVGAALLARLIDRVDLDPAIVELIPDITRDSVEALLKIVAASMLVISTFSVASMVSAYASAGNTATPRSFTLIIADDVSRNALSVFIGVFIFSVVALVALMNGYYGKPGRFLLFALTLVTLALVIVTFLRWVDAIARLGRLGTVIDKVEAATAAAMRRRQLYPTLRGCRDALTDVVGHPVHATTVGYVQQVNTHSLQDYATEHGLAVRVLALPGTFATPDRPIACLIADDPERPLPDDAPVRRAFEIGHDRLFEDDPRFGLVVLSEIASRALSPAVNDPGTAIDIIGTLVRLFTDWSSHAADPPPPECQRVHVPELDIGDMLDDAFMPIARDGASILEVQVRLQKAFRTLAAAGDPALRLEALRHARSALARAERGIEDPGDLGAVQRAAAQ